ncbi:MAG: metal-dependent hydrolase [Gammaproteobacteria bacterium]
MNAPNTARAIQASFPVRRMDFDFEGVDKYWYAGEPGMTFFWSLLSAMFPDGEQFFIDSVRNVREQIVADEQRKKDISAFIGQEAMHRKEHGAYNTYLSEKYGVDLASIEAMNKRSLELLQARLTPAQQLALTSAAEHFTATMAKHFMSDDTHFDAIADDRMRKLLFWHAVEESEHKAVAFDVLKEVDDSYLLRAGMMAFVTTMLLSTIALLSLRLMRQDGQAGNWRAWGRYAKALIGRRGFFTRMTGDYLDYYRPGFHPNDHDTRALEASWKQRLAL